MKKFIRYGHWFHLVLTLMLISIMQYHSVQFWQTLAGEYLGIWWSLTIEMASFWCLFQIAVPTTSTKEKVIFKVMLIVLIGLLLLAPIMKISERAYQDISSSSVLTTNNTNLKTLWQKQARDLDSERTVLEARIRRLELDEIQRRAEAPPGTKTPRNYELTKSQNRLDAIKRSRTEIDSKIEHILQKETDRATGDDGSGHRDDWINWLAILIEVLGVLAFQTLITFTVRKFAAGFYKVEELLPETSPVIAKWEVLDPKIRFVRESLVHLTNAEIATILGVPESHAATLRNYPDLVQQGVQPFIESWVLQSHQRCLDWIKVTNEPHPEIPDGPENSQDGSNNQEPSVGEPGRRADV